MKQPLLLDSAEGLVTNLCLWICLAIGLPRVGAELAGASTLPFALATGTLVANSVLLGACSSSVIEGHQRRALRRLASESAWACLLLLQCLCGYDVEVGREAVTVSLGSFLLVFLASVGSNVGYVNVEGVLPFMSSISGVGGMKLTSSASAAALYWVAVARAITTLAAISTAQISTSIMSTVLAACYAAGFVAYHLLSLAVVGAHLLTVQASKPLRSVEILVHGITAVVVVVASVCTDAALLAYVFGIGTQNTFLWCTCISAVLRFVAAGFRGINSTVIMLQVAAVQSLQRAQAELRAQEMQTQMDRQALFRYFNHEYRGPLNAITLGLDLLCATDNLGSNTESTAVLADMKNETAALDRMLLALHELSTVEQERFSPPWKAENVRGAVYTLLKGLARASAGLHIDAVVSCVHERLPIYSVWFERVMRTFVENAEHRARRPASTAVQVRVFEGVNTIEGITVFPPHQPPLQGMHAILHSGDVVADGSASVHHGWALDKACDQVALRTSLMAICVANKGSPINPPELYGLFRPFEQLRLGNSVGPDASTGLSLAIVRALTLHLRGCTGAITGTEFGTVFYAVVPVHGVEYWDQLATESTFSFGAGCISTQNTDDNMTQGQGGRSVISKAPLIEQNERAVHSADPPLVSPQKLRRVLVVDDSSSSRKMMRRVIEMRGDGWTIEEAADGRMAIDLVEAHPSGYYSLIFMDNEMPVMPGEVAINILRERGVDCPIVMITGTSSLLDSERFLAAGATAVLTKPAQSQSVIYYLQLKGQEGDVRN